MCMWPLLSNSLSLSLSPGGMGKLFSDPELLEMMQVHILHTASNAYNDLARLGNRGGG